MESNSWHSPFYWLLSLCILWYSYHKLQYIFTNYVWLIQLDHSTYASHTSYYNSWYLAGHYSHQQPHLRCGPCTTLCSQYFQIRTRLLCLLTSASKVLAKICQIQKYEHDWKDSCAPENKRARVDKFHSKIYWRETCSNNY